MGSVDLQLLGIGHNGHIGFNEPADAFDKLVHCVNLTQSTIEANKRFFCIRRGGSEAGIYHGNPDNYALKKDSHHCQW